MFSDIMNYHYNSLLNEVSYDNVNRYKLPISVGKSVFKSFINAKAERLAVFADLLLQHNISIDNSEISLLEIGDWFIKYVDQIGDRRVNNPNILLMSIRDDLAIFLGEMIILKCQNVSWRLAKNRKAIHYNRPVLAGREEADLLREEDPGLFMYVTLNNKLNEWESRFHVGEFINGMTTQKLISVISNMHGCLNEGYNDLNILNDLLENREFVRELIEYYSHSNDGINKLNKLINRWTGMDIPEKVNWIEAIELYKLSKISRILLELIFPEECPKSRFTRIDNSEMFLDYIRSQTHLFNDYIS